MQIGEHLYFAPNIRFDQLDLQGLALPEQFAQRIRGFYLDPAGLCAEKGFAFASGVLLVACIDALARFRTEINGTGERFRAFTKAQLPSFGTDELAKQLYDDFRCGLVHESRIKRGAQFSFDFECTALPLADALIINPSLLLQEVSEALDQYVALLQNDENERHRLAMQLTNDHAEDF